MRRDTARSLLLLILAAATVRAQYFGQNKVRYKDMDFKVLQTEHFNIYYYPEERDATVLAGKMAERWHERYAAILQHELSAQPVILYDSAPAFRQTNVIPGEISVGTGGVTEGVKRRVVLPFAGPLQETDHVLGHELVHAFQYDMTSGPGDSAAGGAPGAATLPLWFIEGMAEYMSLGPVDPNTAMWLRDAVERDKLPNWKQLDDPEYFPYRFGQALWTYIGGLYGDQVIGDLLRAAGRAHSVGSAIQSVLDMQPSALIERWHTALRDAYEPVLQRTKPAADQASTVIQAKSGGRSLNVSPVISPDGKQMVVYSERSLFSVDLYLADAQTGAILRRLTQSALDPHFDSMEFIESAGAWSPDGSRFAFATLRTGWPDLDIYNFARGSVTDHYEFRSVGQIFTPTWSPDGKRIAFSAIAGGLMDLYVYDIDSRQLRRLTNDAFAEMQPAWSPSGRFLVFSTDRFTTNLDELSHGQYRLALMDVSTGDITALPAFPEGKHIDPRWGDSDETLYFVSDQDGIPNIYRMDRNDGSMTQLTDVQTGVSGIAPLSPAISVSPASHRLLFSDFTNGMYGVYALDTNAAPPVNPGLTYARVATLPPLQQTQNAVEEERQLPTPVLPQASAFTTHNYHPHLQLDYVAPPTISAGVGSYGAMVGGGTAFYWSDLLEQHQLMTSFQSISSSAGNILRNVSAIGAYQNRKSRWTWGFIGGQTPYQSGGYTTVTGTSNGQPVVAQQAITVWQIERQATGLLAYPFNRAMRVEFTGGYRNIGFAAQSQSYVYSATSGQYLGSQTNDIKAPSALNMGAASAALVYDTSIFGGTSPVIGRRYRFEAGTQAGSLNFSTALADYRQYFRLPANLTFAVRGMHFGRYGGGAENSRLQDLYVGYATLIRGYTANSFSASECGPSLQTTGSCPAFDQLLGSKMAVGNVELRIPLVGALGLIPSRGYPPIEIAPFFDVAYAWRNVERSTYFMTHSRKPIRSYGGSLRANVLGFFVAQVSYVNPMDRPLGWHWEFAITPGF